MPVLLEDELFKKALPVLKQIESHGYEAYFVGGCVRDTLLNKTINDIDIASSARPEEIEKIFKTTFDVGKEHGTIVVLVNNEPYEVTTFRTEGDYKDYRRPDEVNFVRNLEEDTLRRDFTINAMAINGDGELFDYHGGVNDLNNKIIRCVGIAMERFEEDALRMMRAIRFASQLGFFIEEKSFEAILKLKKFEVHFYRTYSNRIQ
ncbi:CCA tRNA nucleotidyltransferase [Aerococcaceae bacterium WGS1372]